MLEQHHRLAIYAEGAIGKIDAKMAEGILRYSPNPIACVIDSTAAGKQVRDVCPMPNPTPIVDGIKAAIDLGADALVLGTAPSGGRIPQSWWAALDEAVAGGLSIVNGLHDRLGEHYGALPGKDQWIWDIRIPAAEPPPIGSAQAAALSNKRVLMVGSDMANGKMTAGLEIQRWLAGQGVRSSFLATGQTGVAITGRGIPLDAYKVDHACGAVEQLVLSAADDDIVIVEGQGSLVHPGSTASLPLIRGTCPTHFVLSHRAGQEYIDFDKAEVKIPPLRCLIDLFEAVAGMCGSLTPATTIGIALNTRDLTETAAREEISRLESELGLPVEDVVRFGPAKLARELLGD
jgi:uncharacterized NAD-dependent epimerase/dehydratase family protein